MNSSMDICCKASRVFPLYRNSRGKTHNSPCSIDSFVINVTDSICSILVPRGCRVSRLGRML